MLNSVLEYLNNYFFKYTSTAKEYSYAKDITFTTNNTMAGDFTDTFLVGEYVLVEGSRINDGVYLISAIDDTTITIDATVDLTIDTEPQIDCTITKLFIPKQLISLIAEIKDYNTNVTTGIASESQGNRSVSYGGSSGWKSAFSNQLSVYKKLRWC